MDGTQRLTEIQSLNNQSQAVPPTGDCGDAHHSSHHFSINQLSSNHHAKTTSMSH